MRMSAAIQTETGELEAAMNLSYKTCVEQWLRVHVLD